MGKGARGKDTLWDGGIEREKKTPEGTEGELGGQTYRPCLGGEEREES